MKGDFSRNTFDPEKFFTRVLMQQGRVQVDADWNEQVSILLHYMRTLATDLMGPHGGPGVGFKIDKEHPKGTLLTNDFVVKPEHYYVKGGLCEIAADTPYSKLDAWRRPDSEKLEDGEKYIVYLDVWERHISHVVDNSIREKALNGPDTATRAQHVWQIRVMKTDLTGAAAKTKYKAYENFLGDLPARITKPGTGYLTAATDRGRTDDSGPCNIAPESRYRGAENQLYRVEIHSEQSDSETPATWKWSRDNGAVVFPIRSLKAVGKSTTVTVDHLGRDDRFGLEAGDWIEVVDDNYELLGLAHRLLKVKEVRTNDLEVILDGTPLPSGVGSDPEKHPLLRRWDQQRNKKKGVDVTDEGVIPVAKPDTRIEIEDGIFVEFSADKYRTGDYWLIPARVATGDIEWPKLADGNAEAVLPHGTQHSYAPLAHIVVSAAGTITPVDLRHKI